MPKVFSYEGMLATEPVALEKRWEDPSVMQCLKLLGITGAAEATSLGEIVARPCVAFTTGVSV